MSYTNIVSNASPSYGVVNTNRCGVTVSRWILFNNSGTLISAVYLSMTISNCIISHSDNFHTFSPIIQVNITKDDITPIYDIQFFDSHYCGVLYDVETTSETTPYRSYGEATPDNTCKCNCSNWIKKIYLASIIVIIRSI